MFCEINAPILTLLELIWNLIFDCMKGVIRLSLLINWSVTVLQEHGGGCAWRKTSLNTQPAKSISDQLLKRPYILFFFLSLTVAGHCTGTNKKSI